MDYEIGYLNLSVVSMVFFLTSKSKLANVTEDLSGKALFSN
jgi:hypothetical protein